MSLGYPDPMNAPTSVTAMPATGRVSTLNPDGTLEVKHDLSRRTWASVALRPKAWTPAVGDRVLVDHVNGNPQTPAIVAVLA